MHLIDPINEFTKLLVEFDLLENNIKHDGRLHRCKALGDKSYQKSGSYVFMSDYPYNYFIKNYRSGNEEKGNLKHLKGLIARSFHPKTAPSTDKEDLAAQHKKKAFIAYKMYQQCQPITQSAIHSYLKLKNVAAFGIKLTKDNELMIPGRDVNGKIWTFQKINPEGQKTYLHNAKKAGAFHKVGWVKLHRDYSEEIYIAEGYATAASIHMSMNKPCVVAFDAGNLLEVSTALKTYYPQIKLVLCLDADYAGVQKGLEAAAKVKGYVIIPVHTSFINGYDFNDLHNEQGLNTIAAQINQQKRKSKLILIQAYKLLHNEIALETINPAFRDLTNTYIHSYYIPDAVKKIAALKDFNAQKSNLANLNPDYLEKVNELLIATIAKLWFKNQIDLSRHFFNKECQALIYRELILAEAKKITEMEDINIRRMMINKINPIFTNQLKKSINIIWSQLS